MRKIVLLLASMTLAVLLASGVALAAAGDLDPTFAGDGTTILDLPKYRGYGEANAVTVHPEGGLVVVGESPAELVPGSDPPYSRRPWVVRLRSDGSLDSSFGGGDGVVFTGRLGLSHLSDVVVRPDGKIVAAGNSGYGVALVRYNSNGTLDKSFGGDGKVSIGVSRGDQTGFLGASALHRQPDGKLVIAGNNCLDRDENSTLPRGFALVRFHADGRRDRSFGGGDGIAITAMAIGQCGGAHDLVRRSDGKLVVAGAAAPSRFSSRSDDFALVRYNSNGTLDKSFGGGDGKAYADFGSTDDGARALIRQNGALVAAGFSYGIATSGFVLARFKSDGRLDQSFGEDGKVFTDFLPGEGEISLAYDLIAQDDGKLVAAGSASSDSSAGTGVDEFALARYHPGGRLDTSFGGGDGKVLTDFGAYDEARGLALQRNGKIVAAGGSWAKVQPEDEFLTPRVALGRYLAE